GCNPSATEWRKKVAHGVSRGENVPSPKAPSGAIEFRPARIFFRRVAAPISNTPNPRLTPWTTLSSLLRSYLPQRSKTDLRRPSAALPARPLDTRRVLKDARLLASARAQT